MKIILCTDCGNVMSRFKNKCDKCTQTNFEIFLHPEDPKLKKRLQQITGRSDHAHPFVSAFLVVVLAVVAVTVYKSSTNPEVAHYAKRPTQTAAAPSAVTR